MVEVFFLCSALKTDYFVIVKDEKFSWHFDMLCHSQQGQRSGHSDKFGEQNSPQIIAIMLFVDL